MTKKRGALHPRNPHKRYDFDRLSQAHPALGSHIQAKHGHETIDFSDAQAVRDLNTALLKSHYGLDFWSIPENYLCPGVPGRANYIHYLADLLADSPGEERPRGRRVRVLDIGTGANVIYPIIGIGAYGWSFVGSDIDKTAAKCARLIGEGNAVLKKNLEVRVQKNSAAIFKGLIKKNERFDLTLCNPPFHSSEAEARKGTERKLRNLGLKKKGRDALNFGGQSRELWCPGGEGAFVRRMIDESVDYGSRCLWFTTLISKKSLLGALTERLRALKVVEQRVVDMSHGQRQSRFLAWTFLSQDEQRAWRSRWTKDAAIR